ncbi:DUF1768-domain-containing protein [Penicillium sp. IBT 16267x]|nr:DUF1768-domain-containing protein [Penicillium sp. IBT 16267x]
MALTEHRPIYFWKPEGENGELGQWYPSSFIHDAPQALLFARTHPITKQIYEGWKVHPRSLRNLGRQIPNFVGSVWETERYAIVLEGSYLKFSQNEDLKLLLFATGDRELVEASPRDRIWGIGFGKGAAGMRREEWGLNLLGKALMEVRARLREEGA